MKGFSIRKQVVAGAIAALALGSGLLPQALTVGSTPTALAAELGQAGHHDDHALGRMEFRDEGRRDFRREFRGHRFFAREGFTHRFWGYGYARWYPEYYTVYYSEPVNICSAYYFDDSEGVWYCFTGS